MKHVHLTISIPEKIKHDLFHFIKKRDVSQFITEAIVERLNKKKFSLEEQYQAAALEEERNQEFNEWENKMVGDGLNETNKW